METDHFATKSSPFHVNVERFPTYIGPQKYYLGQLSIHKLRENAMKQHTWQSINLNELMAITLSKFDSFLNDSNLHLYFQLKKQIIKTLVILSDLFSITQFEYLLLMLIKLYDSDQYDDFLIKQYCLIGICKSIAVLQTSPKIPSVQYINKIIKNSIESTEHSLQIAALNGILYLLESQLNKVS